MIDDSNTLKICVCELVKVQDVVLCIKTIDQKEILQSEFILSPYLDFVFNPATSWVPILAIGTEVSEQFLSATEMQSA